MSSENELRQLHEEVRRLESLIDRQATHSRSTARRSLTVTVFMAAIVLVFFLINLTNIQSEFTEENLSKSLELEMRELSPAAMRELNLLGKDVLPVYVTEARKQLQKMGPQIVERLEDEVDQLVRDVLTSVETCVTAAEKRLLEKTEQTVYESYPSMKDAGVRAELSDHFRKSTEGAVGVVMADFMDRFGKRVEDVQEILLKFDLTDTEETPLDLQKKFLHIWLQLLDEEIMAL